MKKLLAAFLAIVMCFSSFSMLAFAEEDNGNAQTQATEISKGSEIPGTDYHITSVKNYSIAPDVSERVITTNNDAGNSQTVANVMEVNTGNGRATVVAGYGNRNPKEEGWTLKTTTDQAHGFSRRLPP